jgi:hypothetical protein
VPREGRNARVEIPSEETSGQTDELLKRDRSHAKISEHAYYLAEQRGFDPGHELEDWLSAESEVERNRGPHEREDPTLCGD